VTSRKKFFGGLAAGWDAGAASCGERLRRVVAEAGIRPGWRVCDVGTGTGVLIPLLARAVGAQGAVVAIDYAPEMIRQARRKRFPATVELLVADIHSTGFAPSSFDAVICNACFPHFAHKRRAMKEIRRILKPGGVLVISHPTGRSSVNRLHGSASGPVRRDRVPPGDKMARTLSECGFVPVSVIDEERFYLVKARRREQEILSDAAEPPSCRRTPRSHSAAQSVPRPSPERQETLS